MAMEVHLQQLTCFSNLHLPREIARPCSPSSCLWHAGQCGLGQFVTDECVERPSPIYGIPANRCVCSWEQQASSQCVASRSSGPGWAQQAQAISEAELDAAGPLLHSSTTGAVLAGTSHPFALRPPACRHALIAAGRVHSVLVTDEVGERTSAFEAQCVGRAQLTMCHRLAG